MGKSRRALLRKTGEPGMGSREWGSLGDDRGTLVLFDRWSSAKHIEERTVFDRAVTDKGHEVVILRA